jgi:hypothetical protein
MTSSSTQWMVLARCEVSLLREAAREIDHLRRQVRTLQTGGTVPGVIVRDAFDGRRLMNRLAIVAAGR